MLKDCKNCPSFVTSSDEQSGRFGRSPDAAMCGRYGHILSAPKLGQDHNDQLRQSKALDCDSYGEPMPGTPVSINARVASPDRSIIEAGDTGTSVAACNGCQNMVKPDAMYAEHGLALGLCRAKGTLIFQPMQEAKGCPWGSPGQPRSDASGVEMHPEFRAGFTVSSSAVVDNLMALGNTAAEPSTYETDAEVTDEDRKLGIRAWREVSDPEGVGRPILLPVFDPSHFSDVERLFIPQTGDDEHPELYVDYAGLLYQFAVDSYTLDETLCLVGEPGLGKTEFARWVAYLMQVPFHRFTFHKGSEVDDMVGKIKFSTEKGTYWVDGRVTKAIRSVCVIVFDELNLAPEEIKEFMRPIMDNSSQFVLDQDEGVVVTRNRHCRVLVAINPAWDIRNLGADEFADAEVNRMSFSWVPYPPEAVERQIIAARCALDGYDIPDSLLTAIVNIAKDIREAAAQGTFPGSWGIRQQIKVARKTAYFDLARAYKQANLNHIEPEARELVLKSIASHDPKDPVSSIF